MKITSLVENTSNQGFPIEHGLSLHIRLADGRQVLFDMGQGALFAENAERLSIHVNEVEAAVVSHGHYDHGGGLECFLAMNDHAKVYLHKDAFLPHYSLRVAGMTYIGIDKKLQGDRRFVLCDGEKMIDEGLILFSEVDGQCCSPYGNRLLFGPDQTQNDTFSDEQNLIVREGNNTILIAGCAHKGIVNILRRAEAVAGVAPTHVLAGMHLVKSGLSGRDETDFIEKLARELMHYQNTRFFTMHCTGVSQYLLLKELMGEQIDYLSCGDAVIIR